MTQYGMSHDNSEKADRYKARDAARKQEEEDPQFILEQKRRLEQRIVIAEDPSNKYHIWQESPSHDHDKDFFNKDKVNLFGTLTWNTTKKSQESKKKSKKKKSKKVTFLRFV